MNKTLLNSLAAYGRAPTFYAHYVGVEKELTAIFSGERENNGKAHCYEASLHVLNIVDEAVKLLKTLLTDCVITLIDAELFVPTVDHPAHIDKWGISLAIPVTDNCTFTIYGVTYKLEKYCIYSFNDKHAHASTGAFIMARLEL
jgi:hypothetical protein